MMSGSQSNYNNLGDAQAQRPEGAMTSRLRGLGEELDGLVVRLNRLLVTTRGAPPPMPVEAGAVTNRPRDLLDRVSQIEHCVKQAHELVNELDTVL
jgi:hypothetical protein